MSDKSDQQLITDLAVAAMDLERGDGEADALDDATDALLRHMLALRTPGVDVEALALVEALDRCEPGITGAFAFRQIHGSSYDGPTYGKELESLRAALRSSDGSEE